MAKQKILVTGSSAVLGTAVKSVSCEYTDREFFFLRSSDCDLTDMEATRRLFEHIRPDGVLHLAAVSGGIGLSIRHPATMLRDNTLMIFSVLEAARATGVRKTVMTLTTGMYPADAPLPLREDAIHDGYPHESNYGSSFAKRLVDPAIRAYREEYGMSVVGLIPSGIFGPNDNFNYEDAPMLPALIRRFYENRDGTTPVVVWGDGSPLREYTYAPDLARIFLWALDAYDDAQCLNIGTIEEHSIRDIAYMVAECTGIAKERIIFDLTKPKGIHRKNVDNSRFINLTGFTYTPFCEGLKQTIDWFIWNYEQNPGQIRLGSKVKGS